MSTALSGFLTYSLPWEAFPRIDVEEFLEILAIGDGDAILESAHRPDFERRLRLYSAAMDTLRARYGLFAGLLAEDPALHARFGSVVGESDLTQRLLFAMHNCFMRGREILRAYNDLLGNAPEYLLRGPTHLLASDNDCRAVQVCICDAVVAPHSASCLTADVTVLLPARTLDKAPPPARASQQDIDALFS